LHQEHGSLSSKGKHSNEKGRKIEPSRYISEGNSDEKPREKLE
jgi:hypothetical protein